MNTHDNLVKALERALPYVERIAATKPTTPTRLAAKRAAENDLSEIRKLLSSIKAEGGS